MFDGIYLANVVFDAGFNRDHLQVFSLLQAFAYINSDPVILSEEVANTDEEDLPVFA